jgi:hypothetical protein
MVDFAVAALLEPHYKTFKVHQCLTLMALEGKCYNANSKIEA